MELEFKTEISNEISSNQTYNEFLETLGNIVCLSKTS
jgi:hypothetical protein